jgi:hypothetical protein
MPDVYISRAGMQNKELDEKFSSTEIEVLQKKLERQEQEKLIETERANNEKDIKTIINYRLCTKEYVLHKNLIFSCARVFKALHRVNWI